MSDFVKGVGTPTFTRLFHERTLVEECDDRRRYVSTDLYKLNKPPKGFENLNYWTVTFYFTELNTFDRIGASPAVEERSIGSFDSDAEAIRAAIEQHDLTLGKFMPE